MGVWLARVQQDHVRFQWNGSDSRKRKRNGFLHDSLTDIVGVAAETPSPELLKHTPRGVSTREAETAALVRRLLAAIGRGELIATAPRATALMRRLTKGSADVAAAGLTSPMALAS